MSICLRRREFIVALGGAAAWPLAVHAQQGDRVRRIGVLMSYDENDPELKRRVSAFTQALADLGWTAPRKSEVADYPQDFCVGRPSYAILRASHVPSSRA